MKRQIISKLAGAVALATILTTGSAPGAASATARISPPGSMAYGKSLAEWLGIYWRWNYGGADLAASIIDGVQMMPLPASTLISGSFTPSDPALLSGQLEITLPAGTPFVLPEFAWIGERYEGYPAVPDDLPMNDSALLASAHPNLTIDGRLVLSDANKAAFYVPTTYFDPIVVYPEPSSYGSVAAVFFQGAGFVSPPLPVGVHVIHLYEPWIIPPGVYGAFPDGFGQIYDNTWIITVVP